MNKNKEQDTYIGSMSETIDVVAQRNLLKITHKMCGMLTAQEWMDIMNVYNSAISRIFKENNMED